MDMQNTQPQSTEPAPEFPIYKFGNRWICDGPNGRFHARTKTEALEMLATGGYARELCKRCKASVLYGSLDTDLLCVACR